MSLLETLEKIRNSPDPENEKAVEAKILTPILENLGWDLFGPDLYYRYPVGDKKDRGEVDIALIIKERPVAIVEAKASREKLEGHVGQVLRYAFYEGVQICVLTNGQEWWLYLPREEGLPLERRFSDFNIKKDSIEKISGNLEAYLSKENLSTPEAEKRAKEVLRALRDKKYLQTEIPRVLNKKLDEPDEELVSLVIKWVDNEIGLRPTKEQVVVILKSFSIPKVLKEKPSSDDRTKKPSPPSVKPVGIKLFEEYYEIKLWNEVIKCVADVLYERHRSDFHRVLNLRTFASQHADHFRYAYEVGDSGIFVSTNLNSQHIEKGSRKFLEELGYRSTALEILFEEKGRK